MRRLFLATTLVLTLSACSNSSSDTDTIEEAGPAVGADDPESYEGDLTGRDIPPPNAGGDVVSSSPETEVDVCANFQPDPNSKFDVMGIRLGMQKEEVQYRLSCLKGYQADLTAMTSAYSTGGVYEAKKNNEEVSDSISVWMAGFDDPRVFKIDRLLDYKTPTVTYETMRKSLIEKYRVGHAEDYSNVETTFATAHPNNADGKFGGKPFLPSISCRNPGAPTDCEAAIVNIRVFKDVRNNDVFKGMELTLFDKGYRKVLAAKAANEVGAVKRAERQREIKGLSNNRAPGL